MEKNDINIKMYTQADLFKLLSAVLVVGIHTQPFGDRIDFNGGGYWFTTICRIAVPFFFVFSSYVFFKKHTSLWKYVRRLLFLEIAWTILECPLIAYKVYISFETSLFDSILQLFQCMLFGESYMGSWFIHASWMGMIMVYYLSKTSALVQAVVSILFFGLALIDTSYKYLIVNTSLENIWNALNSVLYPSESFIMAVPYLMVGKLIANNRNSKYIKIGFVSPARRNEAPVCCTAVENVI